MRVTSLLVRCEGVFMAAGVAGEGKFEHLPENLYSDQDSHWVTIFASVHSGDVRASPALNCYTTPREV